MAPADQALALELATPTPRGGSYRQRPYHRAGTDQPELFSSPYGLRRSLATVRGLYLRVHESSLGVAPEARKRVAGGKREARSRRNPASSHLRPGRGGRERME